MIIYFTKMRQEVYFKSVSVHRTFFEGVVKENGRSN